MDTYRKRPIRHPLLYLSIIGLVAVILLVLEYLDWNHFCGYRNGCRVVYAWKVEKVSYATLKNISNPFLIE